MSEILKQAVVDVLRENNTPVSISDLRFALPSPRPGYVELERLILIHDNLFRFVTGGAVELTADAMEARGSASIIDGAAFAAPKPLALCGYYEDCIREDGRRIRVYGSHLASSAMETESEWVSDERGVYSIPVTAENRDLILNNSNSAAAHYYGYPILAQWVEDESVMKFVPILFWKLERIGDPHEVSHRLSFTLQAKDVRLNPEVLWSLPARERKRVEELFENAKTLPQALELIQADFLGHEVKEILFQRRLPKNPQLKDLGRSHEGIYNRGLYLSITPNSYVKGLATELSLIARSQESIVTSSSLGALFTPSQELLDEPEVVVPATRPLNAYQEVAVERALSNRLSVVTGPPGTGKSEVVVAIIANALHAGKSVLFASRNNGAISVVQNRVEAVFGADRGLLRLGAEYDSATKQKVLQLLNQPTRRELTEKKAKADVYDQACLELQHVIETIGKYEQLSDLARSTESRFKQALSVFSAKDELSMPVKFTSKTQEDLERIIEEIQMAEWRKKIPLVGQRLFKNRLNVIETKHAAVARSIEIQLELAEKSLTELASEHPKQWSRLALQALDVFDAAKAAVSAADELESLGSLESLFEALEQPKKVICECSSDKIAYYLNELLSEVSREQGFQHGAQQFGDTIARKQEPAIYAEHPMQSVLKALPFWTVSNLSACGRLPMVSGLFDLVVIDEASQCDIPSCVPLMFRAKQAVIIGDPMQLGSITNLGRQSEQSLLKRHGIGSPGVFRYSGNSIYDLAAASAPSTAQTFLAQHYRCHPDIIEFANSSHWYDSNLEAVTNASSLKRASNIKLGVTWLDVTGTPRFETTGFWIPEEVDRIAEELVKLILDHRFEGTVGVVTPFRRMANALQQKVEASGIHQSILDACQFRADTAHKFQGDERDIIFYAPCYHPNMSNKHKWFLSDQKNVFNVALSRARSAFVVVGSKDGLRTSGIDYLEDFVEYAENLDATRRGRKAPENVQRGHWEPILEQRLIEEGIPVQAQYSLGPYWLDFGLVAGDRRLDIEVDGEQFHKNESGMRCQKDIDRNIYVKAQGWAVMRFWVYQLRDDLEGCVNQIKQWWIETN
jgi:very-short-patch-repair endonuclease